MFLNFMCAVAPCVLKSHAYGLSLRLYDIEREFLILFTRNRSAHSLHTVGVDAYVILWARRADVPLSDVHEFDVSSAIDVHDDTLHRAALARVAGAGVTEVNFPGIG